MSLAHSISTFNTPTPDYSSIMLTKSTMALVQTLALLMVLLASLTTAAATPACSGNIEVISTMQAALQRATAVNSALKEQVEWWKWHYGDEAPCMWPWAKPGSLLAATVLGAVLACGLASLGRRRTARKHQAQLAALQRQQQAQLAAVQGKLTECQGKLRIVDREATQYLVRLQRVARYGLAGCPDQAQQVASGMSNQEVKDAMPQQSRDRVKALVAEFNKGASSTSSPNRGPNPQLTHLEAEITRLKNEVEHARANNAAAPSAAPAPHHATQQQLQQQQQQQQHAQALQQHQQQAAQLQQVVSDLQSELDHERIAAKQATTAATAAQRRAAMLQKQLDEALTSSSARSTPEPPHSPKPQTPHTAPRAQQQGTYHHQQQQEQQVLSPRSVRFADDQLSQHQQSQQQQRQQEAGLHSPGFGANPSPRIDMAVLQQHILECTQQLTFACANVAANAALTTASGTANASPAPSPRSRDAGLGAMESAGGFGLSAAALSPPPPLANGWVTKRRPEGSSSGGTWAPFSPWVGTDTQQQQQQQQQGQEQGQQLQGQQGTVSASFAPAGHFQTPVSAAAGGSARAGAPARAASGSSLGSVMTAGPTPGSAGSISYVGGRQIGSSSGTVPGSGSGGRFGVASGSAEAPSPKSAAPKMADVLASVAKLHQSVCKIPQAGAGSRTPTPTAAVTPPLTPRHSSDEV